MINIPLSFCRDPFYGEGAKITSPAADSSFLNGELPLFWHDLKQDDPHWQWNIKLLLPQLFKRWHVLDEELAFYHEQENKEEVADRTPEFTALIIQALFWINNQRVPELVNVEKSVQQLRHTPPNSKDRLGFILIAPQRYRCYIQMKSLMEELEKLYARLRVMEKRM